MFLRSRQRLRSATSPVRFILPVRVVPGLSSGACGKFKLQGWELELGFACVMASAVGSVGVWGVWVGPGLVWMGCGVFAAALLWGGRLLAAGHQSSNTVSRCW